MQLIINIEIPVDYMPQLRTLMHKCVDFAFEGAETNAAVCRVAGDTLNGPTVFEMKMDRSCIIAMRTCSEFHRTVKK